MTTGFRALADPVRTIEVLLEGAPVRFDADRSILANLLLLDRPPVPFLCAIGHCQRCLVTIDGEKVLACRTYARGGERIEV